MSVVRTESFTYWPRCIQSDGTSCAVMEPVLHLERCATWLSGDGWSTADACALDGTPMRNKGAQPTVALDAESTSL